MALEGVGILASLDYIVVLNRCLGNFYILNNDSWRQKAAVGMRAGVKKLWSHKENVIPCYSPEQLGVDKVYVDHKYS